MDILTGQWYVHDDRKVSKSSETRSESSRSRSKNSCIVFYIRNDLKQEYLSKDLARLHVPESVATKLNARHRKISKPHAKSLRGNREPNNISDCEPVMKRSRKSKNHIISVENMNDPQNSNTSVLISPVEGEVSNLNIRLKKRLRKPTKLYYFESDDSSDSFTDVAEPKNSRKCSTKKNDRVKKQSKKSSENYIEDSSDSESFVPAPSADPKNIHNSAAPKKRSIKKLRKSKKAEFSEIFGSILDPFDFPEIVENDILNFSSFSFTSDTFPFPTDSNETSTFIDPSTTLQRVKILLGVLSDLRLGQKFGSFESETRNFYLEHILFTLSRNPLVVKILFEAVKTRSNSDILFKITFVVLKMLLGLEVCTASLTKDLEENFNFTFDNASKLWIELSKLLPESISPIPNFKFIQYQNDEPIQFYEETKGGTSTIKPFTSIPSPGNLNFNGVYFDTIDASNPAMKRRLIFKSEGLIIPIGVDREAFIDKKLCFDENPIYLKCHDKGECSYIAYDPVSKRNFSIHLNALNHNEIIFFIDENPSPIKLSPQVKKYIVNGLKHFSELVLFCNLDDYKEEMPFLSEVPLNLLNELIVA